MAKRKQKAPDGKLKMSVNGLTLEGLRFGDRWEWCADVGGVKDGMTMEQAVSAFMAQALASAVMVKRLAADAGRRGR